jgi:hypothetical protein
MLPTVIEIMWESPGKAAVVNHTIDRKKQEMDFKNDTPDSSRENPS